MLGCAPSPGSAPSQLFLQEGLGSRGPCSQGLAPRALRLRGHFSQGLGFPVALLSQGLGAQGARSQRLGSTWAVGSSSSHGADSQGIASDGRGSHGVRVRYLRGSWFKGPRIGGPCSQGLVLQGPCARGLGSHGLVLRGVVLSCLGPRVLGPQGISSEGLTSEGTPFRTDLHVTVLQFCRSVKLQSCKTSDL